MCFGIWNRELEPRLIVPFYAEAQRKHLYSEKRKVICKALRYAAHLHGASLVFTSQKDENLVAKVSLK